MWFVVVILATNPKVMSIGSYGMFNNTFTMKITLIE
jgi:hypothetical protein